VGLVTYKDRVAFAALVERAMRRDSGWASSAHKYIALYESLTAERR
jgi:glycogen synthase